MTLLDRFCTTALGAVEITEKVSTKHVHSFNLQVERFISIEVCQAKTWSVGIVSKKFCDCLKVPLEVSMLNTVKHGIIFSK